MLVIVENDVSVCIEPRVKLCMNGSGKICRFFYLFRIKKAWYFPFSAFVAILVVKKKRKFLPG